MDGLQKLKEIGKEKIREKTNLDLGKIEDILEKRFEKIAPVRAKGFIQVLQKTFDVDLSDWLAEYYQSQKNLPEEKKSEELESKSNALFWVACVGLLVVGGGLLYWMYLKSQNTQTQPIQEQIIQVQPQEVVEEEVLEVAPIQEEVSSQEQKTQKIQVVKKEVVKKELDEYGESVFPNIAFNEENLLFITADTPLWVGIINLDTKKRVAKTKKEFEIPLDKQLLINIARGGFSASLDDEEKYFNTYKPVYLIHTIKGGLKQISKEEFMSLNGGVEW